MRQGFPRRLSRTLGGLVLLLSPAFLWFRSAQALPQESIETQTRSVSGQVVTEEDAVITSGVTITVQSRDGAPVAEVHADSEGRFEVANLSRQTYLLTVSAPGFFPLQHTLDYRGGGAQPATLRVVLTRASSVKTAAPAPALTDLSAPKEARKAYKSAVQDLEAGRVDDARKKFEKAVAAYPCYARALAGLATIQMATRDLDAAATNLRQAIHCDTGFPGAYTSLGQLLNSQLKFGESEVILKQGLRLSPQAWQMYDQLATAHYNQGQYGKAQEEWLRVLSLEPAPPAEVHAKLAAVYLREGVRDKSYAEMQAYLQAAPNGRFASQFKAMMPRLRDTPGATSPPPDPPANPQP
jgi:tetratricopeptide (TPR) repeat protein